jgi:hypothetical protein
VDRDNIIFFLSFIFHSYFSNQTSQFFYAPNVDVAVIGVCVSCYERRGTDPYYYNYIIIIICYNLYIRYLQLYT